MSRSSVIVTGLIGLLGAFLLTGLVVFVINRAWIPILFVRPIFVFGLFLFLAFFSVAEIPVMIIAMRRMLEKANPRAKYIAMLTNSGYVFFAAVYATPFILLTGRVTAGVALAMLCLVRFVSSVLFIPTEQQFEGDYAE